MSIFEKIESAMANAGIECEYVTVCSRTEYICRNTTPEKVNTILKEIGVYDCEGDNRRAYWYDDSWRNDYKTVKINRLFSNGKSWD